ncbi:hypothetical protein CL619_00015 [archaeon]|nr:hypothetical protein [archaeon]
MVSQKSKGAGAKNCSWQRKLSSLLVIFLFLTMPISFALQISETSSSSITDTGATISWTTDESADSLVYYGTSTDSLSSVETISDDEVRHEISITGLSEETEYFYYVESENLNETATDDNTGAYYSFTTEAASEETDEEVESSETDADDTSDSDSSSTDTETSSIGLVVEHEDYVGSENFDVMVTAADGTELRVYVNGGYFSKDTMSAESSGSGTITFRDVPLNKDQNNEITVEATLGDLVESSTSSVYSDLTHPEITLSSISDYIEESSIEVSGKVNEEGTISVTVNNELIVESSEVTSSFSETVNLEEGSNTIVVKATDRGGLSDQEEIVITSDTEAPTVEAEFAKGNEYYQNRAETDLSGTTEAGATVYLYIYRPSTYDYMPEFDDPWQTVTADENGEFSFVEVNFENEPVSLEDFEPVQVPAGLEEVTINGVESIASQDTYSYYVYIIAEDASGKTGYFKDVVTVNSCYSQNLDFQITDVAKYQAPLRLDPTLMDDGREVISAVFTLDYQGGGTSQVDVATGEVDEAAFDIHSVHFEKACTQSMVDDEEFGLGCTIMGNSPDKQLSNTDGTSYYLTWDLFPSEDLSDRDEDFWNDMQKRQVVFPIKVSVTYQELDATGNKGESKTQTSCYDLGYMVDVPIDSEEYIPDWLAEDGVEALNFTVDKIDKVLPYLEKAIMVTGISCIISFGAKIVMRFARIAASNLEGIKGEAQNKATGEDYYCPNAIEQNDLYLQSTIDSWTDSKVGEKDSGVEEIITKFNEEVDDEGRSLHSLTEKCQSTAGLWKAEEALEQAYKWTCDRVFCRAVPAKWTETEEVEAINNVILEQQQCSVSGSCIPMQKEENCREYIEDKRKELTIADQIPENLEISGGNCWWKHDSAQLTGSKITTSLYYYNTEDENPDDGTPDDEINIDTGVYRLTRVGNPYSDLGAVSSGKEIFVYQEDNGEYCGARAESCSTICSRSKNGDYSAYGEGYKTDYSSEEGILHIFSLKKDDEGEDTEEIENSGGGCFKEVEGKLEGPNGQEVEGEMFAAGYTSDCFVDELGEKYQCVCEKDEDKDTPNLGARTANKAIEGSDTSEGVTREKFIYRQDRIYKDTVKIKGTYYPETRYYAGRDVQGAFGANYLLDYFNTDKKHIEVNPFTTHIGAFQTICLSGIRARLVLLRNILDGLRQCIIEAKYTGLQDAGMCKTLFTQHVCGLVYKAIAHFTSSCTPYGFSDTQKEGGLGEQFAAVTSSIQPAMQSSIDDLYSDYDNAAFDNYFAGGAQGLAQSLCLFAFGYDFPLGVDFIQDAAYSVAMKTSVLITPANREFTNYNPKDLTSIHNYEVASVIFAGCRINDYRVYLKCIGSEDFGSPGVDTSCGGEGCDCLNLATDTYASSRIYQLASGYGGESGEVIDIPIESPQKVDSMYRYDHVVVEVNIDANEDVDKCFDTGYRTDRGGIFYQPIKDISPPGVISCQVETLTGRYMCPDIGDLFYGDEGFAYLESPFIECQDPATLEYESCGTPNMLVLDSGQKDLVIKPYIYTDGGGYCMKIKVTGSGTDYGTKYVEIQEGILGTLAPSIDIGEISSEMFGEYSNDLNLVSDSSNTGCDNLDLIDTPSSTSSGSIIFDYSVGTREDGSSGFKVKIPTSVELVSSGYGLSDSNNYLELDGNTEKYLTLDEINEVKFTYNGFEFTNILGDANSAGTTECKYKVQVESSSSSTRNEASVQVEVALLQKPEDNSCMSAKTPVADNALGDSSKKVSIVIQKESVASASTSEIYSEFEGKDYDDAISMAITLITEEAGNLGEATGVYYYVASRIMDGGSSWEDSYGSEIENLLNRFFLRLDTSENSLSQFSDDDIETGEFQTINAYLCVVAKDLNLESKYDEQCEEVLGELSSVGSSISSGSSGSIPSTTLCGATYDSTKHSEDVSSYSCMLESEYSGNGDCLGYTEYLASGYQIYNTHGCGSGSEKCCPP